MPKTSRKKIKATEKAPLAATCPNGHRFPVIADPQRKEKLDQIASGQANAVLDLLCPRCEEKFRVDASALRQ